MNCPKCNAPLDGVDGFCSHCGAFFSQEAAMEPTVNSDSQSSFDDPTSIDPPWLNSTLPAGKPIYSNDGPPNIYASASSNNNSDYHKSYDSGIVPPEIKKWNWGAFAFNIIWGIGNHSYLPLLCLIPIFNFIWMFVCGAKGNEWAWKSGKFNNVEDFIATQETWNRAGLAFFIINLIVIVLYILFLVVTLSTTFSSIYN